MKASRKLGRKSLSKIGAKSRNVLLAGIIALGGGIILPLSAEAAEVEAAATTTKAEESSASETPAYTMGEVVVTATRTEKREVDVPMATEVITEEDIKDSGAKNAAEALQKINGFAYEAFGPLGVDMGTMSNNANIRGTDNGTLILVNGNPIAQRGKYHLQDIAADTIERIEVVKGGGSVLYGSEAMAGVINIITKTEAKNSVTVGYGNYGQQKYHLNVGAEGLVVTYDRNSWQERKGATYSEVTGGNLRTDWRDILNQSGTISYKFNDHLSFLYGHYETSAKFDRRIASATNPANQYLVGSPFYLREYATVRDMAQLNYRDKNWKGSAYFNTGMTSAHGPTYRTNTYGVPAVASRWYDTREKNSTYGLDVQRNWKIGKGTLTAGFNGQHESFRALATFKTTGTDVKHEDRNNWGVFAQWDQKIDKKNSFIIGGRETWSTGASGGKNFSNFSASGQFLHKMNDTNSLFLNISQSFVMPTLYAIYKEVEPADLKPQKGINYEIGWKNITGKHSWKASLFVMRIKDNISATYNGPGDWTFKNEDFKNEGLELSYAVESKNGFSYNAGLTWQNPKVKANADKTYWDRKFGKIQLTGEISYKKDKLRASLSASFLGARVMTPTKQHSYHVKPYFLTTFTLGYAPTDKTEFELTLNNIFDRHDIISHTSSKYYSAPSNFLFSFTQKF